MLERLHDARGDLECCKRLYYWIHPREFPAVFASVCGLHAFGRLV